MATHHVKTEVLALPLAHIASWQIDALRKHGKHPEVQAVLPALQRGSVWRAGQVEALWDSLERKFPVGMFLLTDFRDELLRQDMLVPKKDHLVQATHMLLDGHQRANAIAL